MPRRPLQYKQIKDERKFSILESALPLFAIYNKDVSIDMICQKAKCSHGLVYHYFKNADQIYNELLKSDTYNDLLNSLLINPDEEAYPQITNLVRQLLDIINDSKVTISFALIIIANKDKKSFYDNFCKLVQKGQKEGAVTGGVPSDIVSTFFLTLRGLYLTLLNQKHPDIKVPSIDNILQIFER